MSIPSIKRAGRLALLLIINSLFINSALCQKAKSPLDSVALQKELDVVLAKYGLKSKGFAVNVVSLNQKGGQTAYSITNNYYQNVTVTQQPTLTEWDRQFYMRHIDQLVKDSAITSKEIIITMGNGSNSGQYVKQLQEFLKSKGYETNVGTTFEPFTGIGVNVGLYFDNVTKIIQIYVGNINR